MRFRWGGNTSNWTATRWALVYAAIGSFLSAITYSQSNWHHPGHPYLTVPVVVIGNFVAAIIVGQTVDAVKRHATNRRRAAGIGVLAWVPGSVLGYFLLFPPLPWRQFLVFAGVNVAIGLAAGAVLWEAPDEV